MRRVYIRTDASPAIGWGHLARTTVIAHALQARGLETTFLLRAHDEQALAHLRRAGFLAQIVPASTFTQESAWLQQEIIAPALIFFDFSHPETFSREQDLPAYFAQLRASGNMLVVIDGLAAQCLAERVPILPDWVVTPYVGAAPHSQAPYQELTGTEYFICSSDYLAARIPNRLVNPKVEKVLLTFGGADPQRISLLAIAALEKISPRLSVRLAQGGSFSARLKSEISVETSRSHHSYELLEAPAGLAAHLSWCDLALASTGLTKYELALCGTPAILVSTDQVHANIHAAFAAFGTSWHLGVHSQLTASDLASALEKLMVDLNARQEMSSRGQRLVDGLGVQRMLDKLLA